MQETSINYHYFPRTEKPPEIAEEVVEAFRDHEDGIATRDLDDGLKSDEVLATVRENLFDIGFQVETGKSKSDKIHRPVLFGENGEPDLAYEVDAYHPEERLGLEVEAGRAWKGNAIYRDIVQALMMVQVDTLALAVPNAYKYSGGTNPAFEKTTAVVDTLYDTNRFDPPYNMLVIGY